MTKNDLTAEKTLAAGHYHKESNYWLKKMSGNVEKAAFPYNRKRKENAPYTFDSMEITLSENVSDRLMKLRNNSDIRLHMLMASLVTALLYKYTGKNDITVGTSVLKQEDQLDFINTVLPLRNHLHDSMTFKELVMQMRQTVSEATGNQNYPMETLLYKLNMPALDGDFPLFDITVVLRNIHSPEYLQHIRFNMQFSFFRTGERITGAVEYNPLKYDKDTVKQIRRHFINLLELVLFNVDIELNHIDLLTAEEKQRITFDFNAGTIDYLRNKRIEECFAEQVERTPHRIAAVYHDRHITYKELDRSSSGIARELRQKGIQPGGVVGLMVDRSIEMMTGIFAILKAGRAYLPIAPDSPPERVKYMLEDSSAPLLLTTAKLSSETPVDKEVFFLESPQSPAAGPPLPLPDPPPSAEDPAYIIYTSGSTGKPKGVIVEHRNVINLVAGLDEKIYKQYGAALNVCLLAPYVFDASVQQVFAALLMGHRLHIVPEDARKDGELLTRFYSRRVIDISDGTPTHIRLLVDGVKEKKAPIYVKHFIIGGDILPRALIERFFKRFAPSPPKVSNIYGPTESCVDSTVYLVTGKNIGRHDTVPIGSPMPNEQVYILDHTGRPVPIGVTGELCIAGDGVGRGYLNRQELTHSKFQPNPFNPKGRIYKTGDFAEWLPDGNIIFHGRIDHQVKIRGFRIELGEIENNLLKHTGIKEAVINVIDAARLKGNSRPGSEEYDKYLCAYIVLEKEIPIHRIKERLSQELPQYMIPHYIVPIPRIPFTANGKVDRKAMPVPDITKLDNYTAPRNDVEERLAQRWSEILEIGKEIIGIDSNFFTLGGHSLNAIALTSGIHQTFNVKIPIIEVFNNPVLKDMAQYIGTAATNRFTSIEPAEKKAYYPVSSAQKRLYILQQMYRQGTGYNMPLVIPLAEKADIPKLETTFNRLIKRHESLRTSFHIIEKEPIQKIHDSVTLKIEHYGPGMGSQNVNNFVNNFIRPFDLAEVPLIRVVILEQENGKEFLLVDMHHIISDALSHNILTNDFMALYEEKQLPPLRIQYKDFSQWQNRLLQSPEIKTQEDYWLKEFGDDLSEFQLVTDFERPIQRSFIGQCVTARLDEEQVRRLWEIAQEKEITMNMVLLAIFYVLLFKYTQKEDIIVGTTVAGRRHSDLRPIIGMFVNILPRRCRLKEEIRFSDLLDEVKTCSLGAYENQDYPFEHLVDRLGIQRHFNRNPLFDVIFEMPNTQAPEQSKTNETNESGEPLKQPAPRNIDGTMPAPVSTHSQQESAKYDLTLNAVDMGNHISLNFKYAIELFKPETIEQMSGHYRNLVSQVIIKKDAMLSELQMLTPEEEERMLQKVRNERSSQLLEQTEQTGTGNWELKKSEALFDF